ncbi:MAG: Lrp/AsnC family transcriptional regulator [Candidatus Diapherotrites archaeon]|nr:Lrp/AsnC family transcriptional regulator [Candidatus Diapherotrites archaeon]
MVKLSKSEKKVLSSLVVDARRPYSKIAKDNKLTRQTVHNVVRRLYASGVIQKFTAQLDLERVGLDIKVFSLMTLKRKNKLVEVEKSLSHMKEISQIHRVLGPHDYLLEISVPNRNALTKLFEKIVNIPDVERTESLLVFQTVKYSPNDPVHLFLD